jgi:gliding motility-associated-like protein
MIALLGAFSIRHMKNTYFIATFLFFVCMSNAYPQTPEPYCDPSTIPYVNLLQHPRVEVCVGDTLGWRYYGSNTHNPYYRDIHTTWEVSGPMRMVRRDTFSAWFTFDDAGVFYDDPWYFPGETVYYWWRTLQGYHIPAGEEHVMCGGSYPIFVAYCAPELSWAEGTPLGGCAGECLRLEVQARRAPRTWQWAAPGGAVSGGIGPSAEVCYDAPGMYPVTVLAANPAGADTLTLWLEIAAAATPIAGISPHERRRAVMGDSLRLSACAEGLRYDWSPSEGLSCADCPEPLLVPTAPGHLRYECRVTNAEDAVCEMACTWEVDIAGRRERLFVPNVFTPNGDGNNDCLAPRARDIELVRLTIFDRWGNVVHREDSPTPCWDGHGQQQGVYLWLVEYIDLYTGKTQQEGGDVLLVR